MVCYGNESIDQAEFCNTFERHISLLCSVNIYILLVKNYACMC